MKAQKKCFGFLDEIEEEAASETLHSFIFSRTKFESKGKVRKLKSLLSTALDPERDLNFYPNVTLRIFEALFLVCALKMSFLLPTVGIYPMRNILSGWQNL